MSAAFVFQDLLLQRHVPLLQQGRLRNVTLAFVLKFFFFDVGRALWRAKHG